LTRTVDRVLRTRMRLRDRFAARTNATPGLAEQRPQGSGPRNRHGMPRVPVGQTPTAPGKWPVLDLGMQPEISPEAFQLRVYGACREVRFRFAELKALGTVETESDFHCVTGWSKLDVAWRGVPFAALAEGVDPEPEARFIVCHASDGYTTNLPLEEALKDDVLLVFEAAGESLTTAHGGPVRMITPQLYAWKGSKWICGIEFTREDRPGFWECNGYSNTAHPWRNDRYAR